ncbi:DUF6401 family natural product biosynthesis protein [Pilimelia columellifera]
MSEFGQTGLAVAAVVPGLAAAIDQHAAAVRDSIRATGRPMTRAGLAGYATGLREAATDHGWSAPDTPIDWTRADWVLVRLIAVCVLSS